MLVEVIKQVDKTLDVINLGAEDFIVYYKRKQEESKIFHYGKIVFVILAFIVTYTYICFSIRSRMAHATPSTRNGMLPYRSLLIPRLR